MWLQWSRAKILSFSVHRNHLKFWFKSTAWGSETDIFIWTHPRQFWFSELRNSYSPKPLQHAISEDIWEMGKDFLHHQHVQDYSGQIPLSLPHPRLLRLHISTWWAQVPNGAQLCRHYWRQVYLRWVQQPTLQIQKMHFWKIFTAGYLLTVLKISLLCTHIFSHSIKYFYINKICWFPVNSTNIFSAPAKIQTLCYRGVEGGEKDNNKNE